MREIRPSGSEGGGAFRSSYPILGTARIFTVSGCPSADGHERLPRKYSERDSSLRSE